MQECLDADQISYYDTSEEINFSLPFKKSLMFWDFFHSNFTFFKVKTHKLHWIPIVPSSSRITVPGFAHFVPEIKSTSSRSSLFHSYVVYIPGHGV